MMVVVVEARIGCCSSLGSTFRRFGGECFWMRTMKRCAMRSRCCGRGVAEGDGILVRGRMSPKGLRM